MAGIYDEQILGAQQQAETARKLREGVSAPQGQMVSGWYVPPSITQYMAEALKGYNASKDEKKYQGEYEAAKTRKDTETAEIMRQLQPQANVSLNQNVSQNFDNPQAMADGFAQGGTQTTFTQPDERTRMAALLRGSAVNPDAFKSQIEMAKYDMDKQAEERARQEKFGQQKEMIELTAALRPQQDKLMAVVGPNDAPMYVPQSQAAGMQPYFKPSAAGKGGPMSPEQLDQSSLTAQQALDQAAKIYSHPGKGLGTGMTSMFNKVPGTDAYGFEQNVDTFKAQTFIPLVQALKGMGALSDAEGKKLSDSVGAIKPGMKEDEFNMELQDATRFLFNKAKAAGLNVNLPEFAISEQPAQIIAPAAGQSYDADKEARYQAWKAAQGR